MNENEKPLTTRFWTWDMILLAAINIIFLGLILSGIVLVWGAVSVPVKAWLGQMFGI